MDDEEEDAADRYGNESDEEERRKRRRVVSGFTIYLSNGTERVIVPNTPLEVKIPSLVGGNIIEQREEQMPGSEMLQTFVYPGAAPMEMRDPVSTEAKIRLDLVSFMNDMKLTANDLRTGGNVEVAITKLFDGLTLGQIVDATDCVETKNRMDEHMANFHALFKELMWHTCTAYEKFLDACPLGADNPFYILARDLRVNYRSMYRIAQHAYSSLGAAIELDNRFEAQTFHSPLPPELKSDMLIETDNDLLRLKIELIRVAMREKLYRVGEDLFEPIFYRGHFTYAYRIRCSVSDWVVNNLGKHGNNIGGSKSFEAFEGFKGNANDVIAYFAKRGGLNDLKYTRYMMSFRNGVYFVSQNRLVPLAQMNESMLLGHDMFSCNFFDHDFPDCSVPLDVDLPFPTSAYGGGPPCPGTAYDIPTPFFDKIINDQHWPYEVKVALYVMIGRCLYDQSFLDNWQMMPFFSGRKCTGKSTFCHIVALFYPQHLIGAFATKQEEVFGLQSFLRKYLIVQPEAREKWNLDSGEFLKMVSADLCSIARKNVGGALNMLWRSGLVVSGNGTLPFTDEHGAVARRLLIFLFTRRIVRDNSLLVKIRSEIGRIIYKCNTFYLACARVYTDDMVPWPKYFEETCRDYMKETSSVYSFITGADLCVSRDYYIPFTEMIRCFKATHKNSKCTSANTWRVSLEEEGLLMTDAREERVYPRGSNTRITDWFVDGCDLTERVNAN